MFLSNWSQWQYAFSLKYGNRKNGAFMQLIPANYAILQLIFKKVTCRPLQCSYLKEIHPQKPASSGFLLEPLPFNRCFAQGGKTLWQETWPRIHSPLSERQKIRTKAGTHKGFPKLHVRWRALRVSAPPLQWPLHKLCTACRVRCHAAFDVLVPPIKF